MSKYKELEKRVEELEERGRANTGQISVLKQQVDEMIDFEYKRILAIIKPNLSKVSCSGGSFAGMGSYDYTCGDISVRQGTYGGYYIEGISTFANQEIPERLFKYLRDYCNNYRTSTTPKAKV